MISRFDKYRKGVTSNLAEAFFSYVGRALAGKIKNLSNRGTAKYRSLFAASLYNSGPSCT